MMDFILHFLVTVVYEQESWCNESDFVHGGLTDNEKKQELLFKEGSKQTLTEFSLMRQESEANEMNSTYK